MTAVELPVLPDLGLLAEVELPVMPEQLAEQALLDFPELLALKLPAAWKAPGLPELPGSGTLQELDELPPPFPAF